MTAAQKVRLWFIAGLEFFTFLFLVILLAQPQYTNSLYPGEVVTHQAVFGYAVFVFIIQVAVATLGIISLYRFTHPLARGYYTPGPNTQHQAYGFSMPGTPGGYQPPAPPTPPGPTSTTGG